MLSNCSQVLLAIFQQHSLNMLHHIFRKYYLKNYWQNNTSVTNGNSHLNNGVWNKTAVLPIFPLNSRSNPYLISHCYVLQLAALAGKSATLLQFARADQLQYFKKKIPPTVIPAPLSALTVYRPPGLLLTFKESENETQHL